MKTFLKFLLVLLLPLLAVGQPILRNAVTTNSTIISGSGITFTFANGGQMTISSSGTSVTNIQITNSNPQQQNVNLFISQFTNAVISNQPINLDLSYNLGGLGHLSQKLWTNGNPIYLFFGDSTGADIFEGMLNWIDTYTTNGVQTGSPFIGHAVNYFVGNTTLTYYQDPNYYWGGNPSGSVSMGPGTNQTWYNISGPPIPSYFYGNLMSLYYYSSASNGVATVNISTNSTNWLTFTVNETVGTPEGALICTNWSLGLSNYTVIISNVSGNFRMPTTGFGLVNTNPGGGAIMMDCHSGGLQLSDWLQPGSNNIVSLLHGANPTVTIYQQTKVVGWVHQLSQLLRLHGEHEHCLLRQHSRFSAD